MPRKLYMSFGQFMGNLSSFAYFLFYSLLQLPYALFEHSVINILKLKRFSELNKIFIVYYLNYKFNISKHNYHFLDVKNSQ